MTSTAETGKVQWRWDRFNAKKLTTAAWAARNCIGNDVNHRNAEAGASRRKIRR